MDNDKLIDSIIIGSAFLLPITMFWCCRLLRKFAAKTAKIQAKPENQQALARRRFANDLFADLMFKDGWITLGVTVFIVAVVFFFELSLMIFGTALIGIQLCAFFVPIFIVQNTLSNPDFVIPDGNDENAAKRVKSVQYLAKR